MGGWSAAQQPISIAYKELFPGVIAASFWGPLWASKHVEFCSDNMSVVSVLCSSTSRDPNIMVLLYHLSLMAARHSLVFTVSHQPNRDNPIADALCRFDFKHFHHLAPQAVQGATPVPPVLLAQLLMIGQVPLLIRRWSHPFHLSSLLPIFTILQSGYFRESQSVSLTCQ